MLEMSDEVVDDDEGTLSDWLWEVCELEKLGRNVGGAVSLLLDALVRVDPPNQGSCSNDIDVLRVPSIS